MGSPTLDHPNPTFWQLEIQYQTHIGLLGYPAGSSIYLMVEALPEGLRIGSHTLSWAEVDLARRKAING